MSLMKRSDDVVIYSAKLGRHDIFFLHVRSIIYLLSFSLALHHGFMMTLCGFFEHVITGQKIIDFVFVTCNLLMCDNMGK